MCSHNKIKKVGERLRPFMGGWRIFEVWKCPACGFEEIRQTNFMQYSRNKYDSQARFEIK
jgi:hypothetical protein